MIMLQISLTILLLIVSYILIAPVIISFSVDGSLSRTLRIKFLLLDISIDKIKRKAAVKKKEIDFERLLFDEFKTVNQIFTAFWRFVKALFKSKYHHLDIFLQGGFGAPDITGIVLGAIEAVKPAFGNRITIVYCPDMMAQSGSGSVNAQIVVRVYSVLAEALLLISRLPMLRIVKIFIKIIRGEYNDRTT
jgi:hypothetical protein